MVCALLEYNGVNTRILTMTDMKTLKRLSFGNFNIMQERTTGVKKEKGRESNRNAWKIPFASPVQPLEPDVKPEIYLPPYFSLCTLSFVALIGHCTKIYPK